jgi:hypothetical protein
VTSRILGTRDRRAWLFGVTCVLGLTVALRGVPMWRAVRADARATAAETTARAEELESVLATFDEAMDTLEARTVQLRAIGPALLAGDSPAAAGSNAEALLAELARQSLVRLDAVDIKVDTTTAQRLPLVTIDLQATADITGLSAFLHGLERGPALIAVRQLSVRSAGAEAPPDEVEKLTIHLTAEGVGLIGPRGDGP